MRFPRSVNGATGIQKVLGLLGLASVLWLTSCGAPGPPQPPSLKLPDPVVDLTAIRNGNTVSLHWTMPKKTTDRLPLATQIRGPVHARICRREGPGACQPAGEAAFPAGADAEFQDPLPNPLAVGTPRILSYWVELMSPKGRSAGPSNTVLILAGLAPPDVAGLTAQVRADGVALHWNPASEASAVRLHRKLLTPAPPKNPENNRGIKPDPEPVERDLFVDAPATGQNPANGALDKNARFGEVYEYTAQRVDQITVGGKVLELAGEISASIRVDVVDTFPPAVPHGLVAVFAPQEKTIDLSWEPDTEEDLAGYIVYRIDQDQAENGDWKRISAAEPLIGPAFRDSTIQPGHSYRYAVTAIDLTNHESKRSDEATESVPIP